MRDTDIDTVREIWWGGKEGERRGNSGEYMKKMTNVYVKTGSV